MLRDIYLHGAAGRRYGRHWRLNVATPAEAVRAICTLQPALRAVLRVGWWRLIVGTPHVRHSIEQTMVDMTMGSQPLHVVPCTPPSGEDATSVGKIALGVVLVGVGIAFAQGWAISIGVSMVFGGVAGLLTPRPSLFAPAATDMARPEDRPSFMFNGVTNNTQQGGPVPLVFGLHLVGSVVVGSAINAEDIA